MDLNNVARASIRGGFFLFLGKTSSTVIMALTSIYVTRLLGPEDYGLFTVILIVPSFFIVFSDLGISPAITKFSAQLHIEGKDRKAVYLIKAGILFKLIITIIVSLFLIFISEKIATHVINRPGTGTLIRISSLYLVGQAVLNSVSSTFIGLDEVEKSSLLINIQAVVKAVASPALIIVGLGLTGAIMGKGLGVVFAATSGAAMLLLYTCSKLERNSGQSENIDFSQGLKMLLCFGAPIYLSKLIGSLKVQFQGIILSLLVSNISMGNYHSTHNFIVLITLLASPIATSLFPAFSKINIEKDRNSIERMFKLSVKYTSLIIIPASIALAVLSKNIVYALYGSQFQTAPIYLTLYMLNFLCMAWGCM